MKKIMLLVAVFLLGAVGLFAQVDSTVVVHTLDPLNTPVPGGPWTDWIGWGIGIFLFLWDTVSRIIPTSKDWTVVGKVVTVLNWVASMFNGVGNAARRANGQKAAFKTVIK